MADLVEAPTASPATAGPGGGERLDPVSARLQSLQLKASERRGGGFRWGRLLAFLLLVGAVAGGYFGYQEYLKAAELQLPEVEAIVFGERAGGGVVVDVSGYIVPKKKVSISPQVGGEIKVFPVDAGSKVSKGDLICQIEVDRYSAEFNRAQAAVKSAEARLAGLKAGARAEEVHQAEAMVDSARAHHEHQLGEKERMDRLFRDGAISASDYNQFMVGFKEAGANLQSAEAKLQLIKLGPRPEEVLAAEAEVEQAKASLEQTKFFFDNATIVAPFDGVILEKNAQQGERIHPEVVIRDLCVIADMSEMEAETEIQEQDVAKVSIGHPCQVIPDAFPGRVYEARLERMPPVVNRQRGVVAATVKILEPDEKLLADMNCRVLFLKGEEEIQNQTPTVPSRAIVRREGQTYVFVLDGSTAKLRRVEAGRTLGDEVEVVEGLERGEHVLLPAKDRPLADGRHVRARLLEEHSSGDAS